MADRFFNRDRNRFYNNQNEESFSNRGRDFEEDYDFEMRNRGYQDYGRDYDQEFDRDWGRRQQYGYGGQGGYGYNRGNYGWQGGNISGMGGGYGRGSFGPQGPYGRSYGRSDYGRGFYGSDFDDEGDYGSYSGYGQSGYNAYNQGGYGRGFGTNRRYGSQGYGRNYGSQGNRDAWERSSNRGYSYQSGFDNENDYDYEPGGWSYTEIWLIPGPYTGMGPQGYQRSDERIKEEICERLTQHGRLDARNVQVQVNNGEVTLTGSVNERQAKRLAEDTVDNISGVKEVHNQLRVETRQEQQGQMGAQQRQGQTGQTQMTGQGQTAGQTTGQQRRSE